MAAALRLGLAVVCRRCGRHLTATASRERGYGPCCYAFELRVASAASKPKHSQAA
jgi:hypothetical protein